MFFSGQSGGSWECVHNTLSLQWEAKELILFFDSLPFESKTRILEIHI